MTDQGAVDDWPARQRAALEAKIENARTNLRTAEAELEMAVHHLMPLQIGDKELITSGLQTSFQKLRDAKECVADLERLISAPKAH